MLKTNRTIVNQSGDIEHLLSLVLLKLSDKDNYRGICDYGPLEINAFSITFWVKLNGSNGVSTIYVKIPKIVFYNESIDFWSPLTQADRVLGTDEYDSLRYLSVHWKSSSEVQFVKPLCYIKEYNAIITPCIRGQLLFQQYRQSDLSQAFDEPGVVDQVLLQMSKFGASLYAFHSQAAVESAFKCNDLLPKLKSYCEYLVSRDVSDRYLTGILDTLSEHRDMECSSLVVNNLKGIDVRQIYTCDDNILRIIDPGKISKGYREIDLARFIVTCRILYWGTFRILWKATPDQSYEQEFLKGYSDSGEYSERMLSLLIIKELFKQWKMGHTSLAIRKWPGIVKYVVQNMYIDPFYKWLITNEVTKLET